MMEKRDHGADAVVSAELAPRRASGANNRPATTIDAAQLGCAAFRKDYGLKYAYLAGAMYKGIGSKELVVAMGKAGLMAYLGTGGVDLGEVESAIRFIQAELAEGQSYGMNFLSDGGRSEHESRTIALYFRYGIRFIEAAAFTQMTPGLVHYRLKGVRRTSDGEIHVPHRIMGKVSRPEVAEAFMRPAPKAIVAKLVQDGLLTAEEAELGRLIPMANELCIEADSAGHTDQGVASVLYPAILRLRDDIVREENYASRIRVGAAGGIGTPEAAAAAFILGADFIVTGSINQCTVEAGTSDAVKDMLQSMNVQDTDYAPAGDMFEMGARVQVLKKGLFFPARANKLYELYMRHGAWEEIDEKIRQQIQEKYFKRTFDDVWAETRGHYGRTAPEVLNGAEKSPKKKMALVFRWYFIHTTRLALKGSLAQRVDYQIHCGPALGAFNQWVKGTELEDWRRRRVAEIGEKLMTATSSLLGERIAALVGAGSSTSA